MSTFSHSAQPPFNPNKFSCQSNDYISTSLFKFHFPLIFNLFFQMSAANIFQRNSISRLIFTGTTLEFHLNSQQLPRVLPRQNVLFQESPQQKYCRGDYCLAKYIFMLFLFFLKRFNSFYIQFLFLLRLLSLPQHLYATLNSSIK